MKRIFIALVILLNIVSSCGNKNDGNKTIQKQNNNAKVDSIIPVQRNILGIQLGKSTLAESRTICAKNGWDYDLIRNSQDTAIDINSGIDFGDIFWDYASILFYRYKAYMVCFFEDNIIFTHTKAQQSKRFQSLANRLLKKYPKAKLNANKTSLTYTDGVYSIELQIVECQGLTLAYSINEKQLDKVIGSEL